MNNCTFVGRIGKDAQTRDVGQSKVTSFSVASNVGYGDKKTTIWLDCSIWGDRGVNLVDALKKGAEITVTGELSEREWTNNDGETKKSLSLRIDRNTYPSQRNADQAEQAPALPAEPAAQNQPLDDDIPF